MAFAFFAYASFDCSLKGEVAIRRDKVTDIEWHPDSFIVRTADSEITITKVFAGYRSLKRLVESWKSVEATWR